MSNFLENCKGCGIFNQFGNCNPPRYVVLQMTEPLCDAIVLIPIYCVSHLAKFGVTAPTCPLSTRSLIFEAAKPAKMSKLLELAGVVKNIVGSEELGKLCQHSAQHY